MTTKEERNNLTKSMTTIGILKRDIDAKWEKANKIERIALNEGFRTLCGIDRYLLSQYYATFKEKDLKGYEKTIV